MPALQPTARHSTTWHSSTRTKTFPNASQNNYAFSGMMSCLPTMLTALDHSITIN